VWEAEIRGLHFQASSGKKNKVHKTPSQWIKLGMGACKYHPTYGGKHKIGKLLSMLA
jgi:hypothetical protein